MNSTTEKLLIGAVEKYFISILNSIHINYPKAFTLDNKNELTTNIKINIKPHNENDKKKIKKKIASYNLKKKTKNTGISHKRKNTIPKQNERCIARVWGNGKIIESKKEIIYGDRCSKKKLTDSKYCHMHKNNNAHGDFGKIPNEKIIYNYNKHNKEKNKEKNK